MLGRGEGLLGKRGRQQGVEVGVQALMLWSAGGVDVKAYEEAVEGRKNVLGGGC